MFLSCTAEDRSAASVIRSNKDVSWEDVTNQTAETEPTIKSEEIRKQNSFTTFNQTKIKSALLHSLCERWSAWPRLLRHLKSDGVKAKPHTAPRALSEAVTTIDSDWL